MIKRVFFLVMFLFLGVGCLAVMAQEEYYNCIQPGDPCCFSQKNGRYCENGLQCGENGFCTNKIVEECGELGQQCCAGDCNPGYKCIDNLCKATKEDIDSGTFKVEHLSDYPDDNKLKFSDSDLGGIISVIIKIVYWLAGLSMMAMIIIGGLQVMTSLGIPEKMKMGYGKMTGGIVGFLIIFSSYLIVKLVETIFGISILQ